MDLKKLMNTDYLGSWDFRENEKKILTIKEVTQKKVYNPNKNAEELSTVMFFSNYQLGMFLNVTNAKMLIKLFGTSETDNLKGKNITLITKKIKVRGEWIEAVRIDDKLPQQPATPNPVEKENFTPEHKGWVAAVDSLKAGAVTIEQIKAKYTLSEENEKLLIEQSK